MKVIKCLVKILFVELFVDNIKGWDTQKIRVFLVVEPLRKSIKKKPKSYVRRRGKGGSAPPNS